MIEIIGTGLNQWDTGRSVKVTGIEASHVHFANQGDSKAIKMEIKERSVEIPDYLLQTGKDLVAYAVLDGVTLEGRHFVVTKRPKPEDYVYTPEEKKTWEELEERIVELEENGGSGGTTSIPRLIVYITEDEDLNYISSHTAQEIYDYWQNGGEVAVDFDNMDKFIPIRFESAGIYFYRFNNYLFSMEEIVIWFDGQKDRVRHTTFRYATKEDIAALEQNVGDISTALDELHNYAQALIGGEAV